MKRIAAAAALLIMVATPIAIGESLQPCETEDQTTACYWDASEQGNGQGVDFWVDWDGNIHY